MQSLSKTHFIFWERFKFFLEIIDLVFWAKVERVKITPLLFRKKNKTKQVILCKLDLWRNHKKLWL